MDNLLVSFDQIKILEKSFHLKLIISIQFWIWATYCTKLSSFLVKIVVPIYKAGSRHKAQYYDERVLFYIRLLRSALDIRIPFLEIIKSTVPATRYRPSIDNIVFLSAVAPKRGNFLEIAPFSIRKSTVVKALDRLTDEQCNIPPHEYSWIFQFVAADIFLMFQKNEMTFLIVFLRLIFLYDILEEGWKLVFFCT